jgi:hypothetical protein
LSKAIEVLAVKRDSYSLVSNVEFRTVCICEFADPVPADLIDVALIFGLEIALVVLRDAVVPEDLLPLLLFLRSASQFLLPRAKVLLGVIGGKGALSGVGCPSADDVEVGDGHLADLGLYLLATLIDVKHI